MSAVPPIDRRSAGKRSYCTDENITHAYLNAIRSFLEDDMIIYVGPSTTGALLEIGVSTRDKDGQASTERRIVHCMRAREKYLTFLKGR